MVGLFLERIQMVQYKIVKFCKFCRARFVVPNGESKRSLCSKCEEKYREQQKAEELKEAKKKK